MIGNDFLMACKDALHLLLFWRDGEAHFHFVSFFIVFLFVHVRLADVFLPTHLINFQIQYEYTPEGK